MLKLEDQIRRMEENINTKGFSANPGILAFTLNNADLSKFIEAYKNSLEKYLTTLPKAISGFIEIGYNIHNIEYFAIALMVDDFDKCVTEQTYISEGNISKINSDQDKEEIIRDYLEKQGYIDVCKKVFKVVSTIL